MEVENNTVCGKVEVALQGNLLKGRLKWVKTFPLVTQVLSHAQRHTYTYNINEILISYGLIRAKNIFSHNCYNNFNTAGIFLLSSS